MMHMVATSYEAVEYGYVFNFVCEDGQQWSVSRYKQTDPGIIMYTEVLTTDGWINPFSTFNRLYGTLEEIEAQVVESYRAMSTIEFYRKDSDEVIQNTKARLLPTKQLLSHAPGIGDDIACSMCGEVALDTGLECSECGHDMVPELFPPTIL